MIFLRCLLALTHQNRQKKRKKNAMTEEIAIQRGVRHFPSQLFIVYSEEIMKLETHTVRLRDTLFSRKFVRKPFFFLVIPKRS